jgi:transcriptional regulator with PAS, ATPase and Fis domain
MWESQALRRQVNGPANVAPFFVGRSHAMQRIISLIMQVSPTHATVLISGESGVGKEVVARAIHHFSQLREEVFLPVNCGAIPDPLVESQLFGHAKGSFTGADSSHEGLFQHAEGGTIFLDEIGELPPHLQVKLLRAIAEKEILPVGTSTPIEVDVRIIASSNRDLRKAVEEGKFREDLYYRLKVVSIEVPPLRDRREDIPPLVQFLVRRHNAHLRRSYKGLENSTLTRLMSAPWRGNVRELEHVIEYAMIVGNGEWIRPCDLPPGAWTDDASTMDRDDDLTEALRRFERAHIENVLRRLSDDRRVAASRLGIDLSTLYRKIRDLDIKNSS